uniref:Serine hydrolase n=1 Tax=Phenylobacterium glaciei TaxID=2803784 RepID=A0A974P0P0_9CAUL|nr:serine hydrolase [Phenylobacterium glaciei]
MTPGSAPGYHALTQGYLVGEVVRRITGKSLGTVFRQEIAEPLGADFHIGLPASEDARVADLIPPPPGAGIADGEQSELVANMSRNPGIDPVATRTRAWRGAEIPAAGVRAMPARWLRSMSCWPMAASPRASASSPRPAAARPWNCRWREPT